MNTFSLHNVDIIMSYREDSAERRGNLYAVLHYFKKTFTDYTIWLMEADSEPKFNWKTISDPNIQHVFIYNSSPFPKALLYNLGAKISRNNILYFNDVDCIPHPKVLSDCINNLSTTNDNDVLCPYYGAINIDGEIKKRFLETHDFSLFNGITADHLVEGTNILYESSMGASFIFRRKDFTRIGGLDPSFIGWGSEDNELFFRSKRLKINWVSMNTPLFHLHHGSKSRDSLVLEAEANAKRAYESHTMPIEALHAHTTALKKFFE